MEREGFAPPGILRHSILQNHLDRPLCHLCAGDIRSRFVKLYVDPARIEVAAQKSPFFSRRLSAARH